MIKQLKSSEIKNFINENKDVELLDVRTQGEWDDIGKPDGEKLGVKTHFVTIVRSPDPNANKEFVEEVKKQIDSNKQLLIICKACRFKLKTQLKAPIYYSSIERSRALIPTFSRVCWSTFFTMMAAYRLCEPSFDGSEPGTTTAPAGTRP